MEFDAEDFLVLYESFTGGCEAYAEAISQALSCKKLRLSDFDSDSPAKRLVILSPVHAQTIPKIIKNKLLSCDFGGRKVVAVAIYGGVSCGSALYTLCRLISKRGGDVIGAAEYIGEHSYSLLTGQTHDIFDPMQLCEFIKTALLRNSPLSLKPLKHRSNIFSHLPKSMLAALSVRLPKLKNAACTNCGLCIVQCPTSAIDSNRHISKKKCVRCLNCAKVCPEKARHLGFSQPFARRYLCKKRNRKNRFY